MVTSNRSWQAVEAPEEAPIVLSARTPMTEPEKAALIRLPSEMARITLREVLEHLVKAAFAKEHAAVARSVKRELESDHVAVEVNGRTAPLDSPVVEFLQERTHELEDGSRRKYQALDLEVSSVQEGGVR